MSAALRTWGRTRSRFWHGVVAFWLGFGLVYVLYRAGVDDDTKLTEVTLGDIAELAVLLFLWPLEVLGVDIDL